MARAIAAQGATVIGVSRSPQQLNQICAEIEAAGGRAIGVPFDISEVEKLPILLEKIEQLVDSVDILINNAGVEIYNAFSDYALADLQTVLSTNLLAPMELSRLILPRMLRGGSGHIVNIASLAGKKGAPYNSLYSASKAGLLMWTDALRQELAGTGVVVSAICPGYVSDLGMTADTGVPIPKQAGTSKPTDVVKAVIRAIEQDRLEAIVNQDAITEGFTKLLLVVSQFFPQFGDAVYRWSGVTKFNQMRVENRMEVKNYVRN
jgi:short-subunit dehydrogenase